MDVEARLGELIREMQDRGELATNKDNQYTTDGSTNGTVKTLADLGLNKDESSRFQRVADNTTLDCEARSDENLVVYYLDKLLHLKNFGTSLFTGYERRHLVQMGLIEKRFQRKNLRHIRVSSCLTEKCLEILKEVSE